MKTWRRIARHYLTPLWLVLLVIAVLLPVEPIGAA